MKNLLLTDSEAMRLISVFKNIAKRYNHTLTNRCKGTFDIYSVDNHQYRVNYFFSRNSKTIQFRELNYDYTLIRINLNSKFHKNSNGEKIWGNRINIFSEEEYISKGDGTTYYKAFPLPFENIENSDDFLKVMEQFLTFINTQNKELLNLVIQDELL